MAYGTALYLYALDKQLRNQKQIMTLSGLKYVYECPTETYSIS